MRRLPILAAFLLIISLVPVCAQRGGRGGGGGHASFGGSHAGSGGHMAFAGHSAGGFGGSYFGSFAGSRFGGTRSFHRDYSRGERFGFRNRCYGCWGYGYPYYGYYDPYWWWDSGYSSDEDYASDRDLASQMNDENLEEQRMLREQDHDAYARPSRPPRDLQPSKEEQARNDPATVLVYRDQHQREIQNYAIVDGLLFNFTPQRTEKIPLAVLDIPATMKANDDRGVDFHLPGTGEGQ